MEGNKNILFVDDEELILAKIERKLKDEDWTMFFATSSQEALKILDEEEIAVIVLDLSMPEVNGVELLKIIKQDYAELVKIIFSAYFDINIRLTTLYCADVYHYISKRAVNQEQGYKLEFIPVIKRAIEYYNLIQENKNLKSKLKELSD